jgi:hypothetical protein
MCNGFYGTTGLEPALYPHPHPEAEETCSGCSDAIRLNAVLAYAVLLIDSGFAGAEERYRC